MIWKVITAEKNKIWNWKPRQKKKTDKKCDKAKREKSKKKPYQ